MDLIVAAFTVALLLYNVYLFGWYRARDDRWGRSRAMLGMAIGAMAVSSAVFYFWFDARLAVIQVNIDCLRDFTIKPAISASRE